VQLVNLVLFFYFEQLINLPEICLIPESSRATSLVFRRWATKKTAGSTKNGRDSNPKYLGVKKFGGEVHPLCIHMTSINFYSIIASICYYLESEFLYIGIDLVLLVCLIDGVLLC
jgi:hypothetical protein